MRFVDLCRKRANGGVVRDGDGKTSEADKFFNVAVALKYAQLRTVAQQGQSMEQVWNDTAARCGFTNEQKPWKGGSQCQGLMECQGLIQDKGWAGVALPSLREWQQWRKQCVANEMAALKRGFEKYLEWSGAQDERLTTFPDAIDNVMRAMRESAAVSSVANGVATADGAVLADGVAIGASDAGQSRDAAARRVRQRVAPVDEPPPSASDSTSPAANVTSPNRESSAIPAMEPFSPSSYLAWFDELGADESPDGPAPPPIGASSAADAPVAASANYRSLTTSQPAPAAASYRSLSCALTVATAVCEYDYDEGGTENNSEQSADYSKASYATFRSLCVPSGLGSMSPLVRELQELS